MFLWWIVSRCCEKSHWQWHYPSLVPSLNGMGHPYTRLSPMLWANSMENVKANLFSQEFKIHWIRFSLTGAELFSWIWIYMWNKRKPNFAAFTYTLVCKWPRGGWSLIGGQNLIYRSLCYITKLGHIMAKMVTSEVGDNLDKSINLFCMPSFYSPYTEMKCWKMFDEHLISF